MHNGNLTRMFAVAVFGGREMGQFETFQFKILQSLVLSY